MKKRDALQVLLALSILFPAALTVAQSEPENEVSVPQTTAQSEPENDVSVPQTIQGDSLMVEDGKTVKLHYSLSVDGEMVESSEGQEPLEVTIGAQQVIPGFENGLRGMKIDETKEFSVSPEEGYGPEDPEGYKEVGKDKLPEGFDPATEKVLYVQGPDGRSYPVQVAEVKEETVLLNFNHPFAGKTLTFTVKVVEIN